MKFRPFFFTLLAPVFWSTGGVGLRLADVTPLEVLFWRSLFMTLFLFCWNLLSGRKRVLSTFSRALIDGKWVSLFFALSFTFYVFSISYTTVADSLLIQGTAPILIVVIGWLLLREPVKWITVAALAAAAAGLLVIIVPSIERGGLSGNFFGLAKAFAFAAGTIAVRKRRSVALIPAVTMAAALTTVVSALMLPSFTIETRSLLILAFLGVFQTGIAFILFVSWSGKLSPSVTGIIVILEAVLGPLWAWMIIGEKPSAYTLSGGAIILAALVTHTFFFYRQKSTG